MVVSVARKMAEEECTSLREKLGSMANSVWHMNKARLVQVAVREISMDEAEAMKHRVPQLRNLISIARNKDPSRPKPGRADPLKRFNRLKHADLAEQMNERGLDPKDPHGRMGFKNRESMISDLVAYETVLIDDSFSMWTAVDSLGEPPGGQSTQSSSADAPSAEEAAAQPEFSADQLMMMVRNNPEIQAALRFSPGLFN